MIPVAYNLRSLVVRKTTTLATALGIGLVVFVFASVLMLAHGIDRTLGRSGSTDVAVVVRDGSDSELTSSIDVPNVGVVGALPQIARRAGGQPDMVAEIVAVIAADVVGANGVSNMQIRGVPEDVFAFRPTARLVEGRQARPGADEAVIGKAIRGRFKGVDLNQSFEIRKNRRVRVVGIFEDGGSSFESEVWTDVDVVRSAFGREGLVSSIRVRLRSPTAFDAFRRAIESNRQLRLDAKRETDYYEAQSEGTSTFIRVLGIVVAVFFSVGAMIGAMITMYAAVANRSREIGTLRALGFSRWNILVSFLIEAVLLATLGGIVGALASLAMGLVKFSMMNFATWSEIVFRFEPTVGILIGALVFAIFMGLLGGLFPAIRAARMQILNALRA